jgi:hypothetical protein
MCVCVLEISKRDCLVPSSAVTAHKKMRIFFIIVQNLYLNPTFQPLPVQFKKNVFLF